MRRIAVGLCALALIAGCSAERKRSSATPRDVGTRVDSGAPSDSGLPPSDAGAALDAHAPADANVPADAGAPPDAGDGNMCVDGPRKPRPLRRSGVVNGTRQPTLVPMSPEQIMAVVGLGGTSGSSFCSGTLIAERTVLTAQHCTEGEAASAMRVLFGVDDSNPVLAVPVTQKLEHPVRDIALLTLAFAPATQIAVQPIPIFLGTLSAAHQGIQVEQAGYGDTESNTSGRFFVTEQLETVNTWTFTVNGMGLRGVCYGDSGGPSFMVAPEGDVRVLGDLSEGDTECARRDDYVRVDVLRSWIEGVTGPTPTAGPPPCGTVTAVGACTDDGASATYCSQGALTRDECAGGDVCGWSAAGWRCVSAASDPCGGISHLGVCDGQTARWCDRGVRHSRDCAACGEACLFLGTRIGFDCDADPLECGELDFLGRCDGQVSEWCNEQGRRERLDCAARSQVCRYVDADTGYYCADP